MRRVASVGEERFEVSRGHLFGHPGIEFGGPGINWRVLVFQVHAAQIMDDAAGSGDEEAIVAQGAERFAI